MTDNEIYFAAKLYQKNQKDRNYSYEDFLADIAEHKRRSPSDFSSMNPIAMGAGLERLWQILILHSLPHFAGMVRRDKSLPGLCETDALRVAGAHAGKREDHFVFS